MTVRELIEKLKDMPPESKVVARELDGGYFEVTAGDVEIQTRAFYPIGSGSYGYWDRPWDGQPGQMVVAISP